MAVDTSTQGDWNQLGEAVVTWTGYGRSMLPVRDEEALVTKFGAEAAAQLLPLLRELEKEFYASDARYTARDLSEMASLSSEQFRQEHPRLPEKAVEAFAWCYTFDFK